MSLPEPTTWQALLEIQRVLRLIQVSRGYHTDLGLGVVALEGDQLPESARAHTVISALDIPSDDDGAATSTLKSEMDILIESFFPIEDEQPQLIAHRGRADIVRALIGLRRRLRDLPFRLHSLAITGSTIGKAEDAASVIVAQVTARAVLTESLSPANQ